MRVRPKTSVLTRRPARRAHEAPRPRPEVAAPQAPAEPGLHLAERRARESGGPLDRAQYSCGCGLVFDADVSTSVVCPHCTTTQAW